MGALTEYLQDSSAEFCPPGWTCRREVSVLDGAMAELFGYMTIELYASLDESEPRFDGNRAWRHLNEHLAMNLIPVTVRAGKIIDGGSVAIRDGVFGCEGQWARSRVCAAL